MVYGQKNMYDTGIWQEPAQFDTTLTLFVSTIKITDTSVMIIVINHVWMDTLQAA